MKCTFILRNTLWSSYLSIKSTTSENNENNGNKTNVKENYDDNDSCIGNKYNERQTCSSPTLVVTLYDRLVRKGVIRRDLEQRVMAEACTPLLRLIRRTADEETKTYKHNKFVTKFSSLSSKRNKSNFDVNLKIKKELYYNNNKSDTNNVESNNIFEHERFDSNTHDAHEEKHCTNNHINTTFTNISTTFSTQNSCTGEQNSPLHDTKHKHLCKFSLKEWLSYYKLSSLTNLSQSSPRWQAVNWFQWSSPPSSEPLSVVYPESVNFNSAEYDKHGLYLWGEVGIGKTMILDLFDLCELPCTKRRVHLHSFMSELCDRLVRAERELHWQESQECNLHKEEKTKVESLTVMKGRYDDTNNNKEYDTKSKKDSESKWSDNDDDNGKCFITSYNQCHKNRSFKRSNTFLYPCVCSIKENAKFYFSKLIHYFTGQRWHKMWSKLPSYVDVRYRRNSKLAPQWQRPMDKVVDDIIRESRVLCFDEFQTFDVAYAALLASFFTSAFAKGLFMVATSNRPPEELCCTSTSFSEFVPLLHTYCRVLECTSHRECDYRYVQATHALCFHEQIFLYPATLENERKLVAMVERCMRDNEWEPHAHSSEILHNNNHDSCGTIRNSIENDDDKTTTSNNNNYFKNNIFSCKCEEEICKEGLKYDEGNNIKLKHNSVSSQINSSNHQFVHDKKKCWVYNVELIHHGRRCVVPRSCNGVALFDFCDVCTSVRQQLCSIDYQLVAANYHTIILLNVPQVGTLDYNSLNQFIIFIDELYQRNVKLLMTTKVPWKHLMDNAACLKSHNNGRESDKYNVNKIGNDETLLEQYGRKSNEAECNIYFNFNCENNSWPNDNPCKKESSYNGNNLRNERFKHSKKYTDDYNNNERDNHENDGQNTSYEWEEERKNFNTETERVYASSNNKHSDANDSSYNTYYSEGEDDRSSVFANEYTFRNQEELMSIARIRSRLMEMGCVNYLLRDHVNFVTHDYTFANLLNMRTESHQQS